MITMLSQHMNAGGIASRPADPVRSGYVFQGWQLDGETYDFNTPVTKTITLTALWQKNSSGDSSGGGAAAVTHPVSVAATSAADAAAHGSVKASLANAKAGDKVTLTPQPDEGWQVTGVTVTDKNGREVSVTRNADGTYSFIMPDSKVEIAAVFAEIAEATEGRFVDVAADAWYAEAVAWAVERGIMNGVSETSFAPNDDTTRAMVVTMLWRLAGEPAASEPSGFSDVSDGAWYADAVAWATEAGAVTGMTADTFSPNTPVTREQLAAILYRYAQARGKGFTGSWMFLLDYPDAADISEWADEAMHWMVMNDIINGMGDGTLNPGGEATRAQVATMLMRYNNFIG